MVSGEDHEFNHIICYPINCNPHLGVIEEYSTSDEALSTAGGAAGMIPPVGVGEDCIGTNPLLLFCDLFFLSLPPPLEGVLPTPPEEL